MIPSLSAALIPLRPACSSLSWMHVPRGRTHHASCPTLRLSAPPFLPILSHRSLRNSWVQAHLRPSKCITASPSVKRGAAEQPRSCGAGSLGIRYELLLSGCMRLTLRQGFVPPVSLPSTKSNYRVQILLVRPGGPTAPFFEIS